MAGSDLAADTAFTITATGTDDAGNPITAQVDSTHSVDLVGTGAITVDNITADDVLNAAEEGGTVDLTGTAAGELAAGDLVSVTINGTVYNGAVDAGGATWTIAAVAGSDLAADTAFTITATGTDDAGNPITAQVDSTHGVDLVGTGAITVDNITADDVLNAAEEGGTVDLTGTATGQLAAGDLVSVTINGTVYNGAVDAGGATWTIAAVAGGDLAADTAFTITATGTDDAGNPITAQVDSTHSVDLVGTGAITVDNITADDVLNAAEEGGTVDLTGTAAGELAAGDLVSVTINGTVYNGAVDAGSATWTIAAVAGSDLAADTAFTITATGTDDAGNPITAQVDSTHSVWIWSAPAPSPSTTSRPTTCSTPRKGGTVDLTGTAAGELAAGDLVSVTINGTVYNGAVDAGGATWTIAAVAGSDLAADTAFTIHGHRHR